MASVQLHGSSEFSLLNANLTRKSVDASSRQKAELKQAVLTALRNGWSVKRIKAEIASAHTLKSWRSTDAEFETKYFEASAARLRENLQSQAKAARSKLLSRILEAARSGLSMTDISQTICSASLVRFYKIRDPQFRAELNALGNVFRDRECERRRRERGIDWPAIQQALIDGASIKATSVKFGVYHGTVKRRLKRDPEWTLPIRNAEDERYRKRREGTIRFLATHPAQALRARRDLFTEQMASKLLRSDPSFRSAVKNHKHNSFNGGQAEAKTRSSPNLMTLAAKAISTSLPADVRDDVMSDIVLAVLSGEIAEADIPKRAKEFVTAYWRERPEFRLASLDASRFDDGSTTLHETVSRSLWQE